MKKKQGYMVWALALLGLVCTMGCGQKQGPQTIVVTTFNNDLTLSKITTDEIAEIEKRNPGLNIKLEIIPYSDYQQKISTEMAAGNMPDVINVEVSNFVDLYLRGAFQDLKPYIEASHVNLKDYYPGVLERFSRDGQILVMPQDTAPTGLMYYNKKIFKEAKVPFPTSKWSWPEPFVSICKKLTKKNAQGKTIRWAYSEAYPIQFENFMYSNGGNYVDDTANPKKLTMDDPKVVEAVRFRYDLIYKYHVSPSPTEFQSFSAGAGVEEMFMNGAIAMMCSGIWHTPKFLQDKGLDFDVVEFPSGPTGLKGWGTGGSGFAMTKACKNKDLAWKVIQELTSAHILAQLSATGEIQPALISMANSDAFLKSPGPAHKSILLSMPQYTHYQPFTSSWQEILYGTMGPAMDPVWSGSKTPEEVLPELTDTINKKFFTQKQ